MQDAAQISDGDNALSGQVMHKQAVLVPALVLLHALLSWPTLYIYTQTADVPAIYLASGVAWAGFLLLRPAGQAWFAAGIFVTQMAGELIFYDASLRLALTFTVFKTLGPFAGARILERVTGHPRIEATVRDLAWFGLVACFVVPVISMLPPHLARVAEFGVGLQSYFTLTLLEASGIAVMAPVLLFWLQPSRVRISDIRGEPVLITLAALVVLFYVFVVPPFYANQHTSFYAATPVMIWAAARFGCRGAATMNILLAIVMIGSALARLGPFDDQSDLKLSVMELQIFLLIVTAMTLLLGAYAEAREASTQQRARDKRRLQDLSLRLLESEERYRENVATRLHDGVGQTLSLGRMRLDDVLAPPVNPETLAARIAPIQSALDAAINQVRDMTRDVAAGLYRGDDIAAAVHQHMNNVFDGSSVDTTVHSDALPELRHEVAVVVSRAIRECLVNVAKHAKASSVRVDLTLAPNPGTFVVTISDDGRGFDLSRLDIEQSTQASFGLSSVRNSMLALGGTFDIATAAGSGTTVTLTLPVGRAARD